MNLEREAKMYLKSLVTVPDVHGKIVQRAKGNTVYVYYEIGRDYDPSRQFTIPKRVTIGKLSSDASDKMFPNQNFLKYFPDSVKENDVLAERSCCLRAGTFMVLQWISEQMKLQDFLLKYFNLKDTGLILDLASYSIITESNVAQYYPDYAYDHPLFTPDMHIYSDSHISDLLERITQEEITGFLNDWNKKHNKADGIYISYDSTNKNCQAGDIEMVEFGHPKVDLGNPIFNLSIAYDMKNRDPLFYEDYLGSINDVSQLRFMLNKAKSYGYEKIGFILDRGYFSEDNIKFMDDCGYNFVIMAKGLSSLISGLIDARSGSFENKRACLIEKYNDYGISFRQPLYAQDEKDRSIHLYYNDYRAYTEKALLDKHLAGLKKSLQKHLGTSKPLGKAYTDYYLLYFDNEKKLTSFRERQDVVENARSHCGYFELITSEEMTAEEALDLYKSRDASEKLFLQDKSFLGDNCLRVASETAAEAKIFIEFIALIMRCKRYVYLKNRMIEDDNKSNFMTVPAAIRELEKIEMSRHLDSIYRQDHAVTATQKAILGAFGLNEDYVSDKSKAISKILSDVADNFREE